MHKLDKAEYKIKLEAINALAERGDFKGAAEAADEIDWRHVRSARTLCMIGEIYEANKRYDDSRTILKYAYRRSAASKTVLYRLAELNIRCGSFDEAKKYINEFEQAAPGDSSRYLLKYRLLKAEKAPLDDQIAILQEYKDHEYTERWAYELARLYKRNGQIEKCVEECDDMILWFSEGKYVTKAMELKMQFRPLSASQQAKYDSGESADAREDGGEVSLTAMANVEKAVVAASDEEDDEPEEAPRSNIFKGDEAVKGETSPDKNARNQGRLADSIRAVFAGIRAPQEPVIEQPEKEEDYITSEERKAEQRLEEAKNSIRELEPESDNAVQVIEEEMPVKAPAEKVEDELDLDLFMNKEESVTDKAGQLDLDKLFAETSSSLAGEVASGDYILADTLEEDRPAAEKTEKALPLNEEEAQTGSFDKNLTDRETDESLGLTREFHFREEIEKAIAARGADAVKKPIMKPEEAARAAVLKETGKVAPEVPEETKAAAPQGDTAELPGLEEGMSDEELLESLGNDQAVRRELLADEDEIKDLPEEESSEDLMNLSSVTVNGVEGSPSIIEHIMEAPEAVQKVPVEPRALTGEEKRAFSYFASIPGIDAQVTSALADIHNNSGDKTSKSGNIVIMGRQGSGKTRLAEGLVLAACMNLNTKAAKMATLVADEFNRKDPAEIVKKLAGGFLIIEAAGSLSPEAIDKLNQAMEFRTDDLIVILEDEKQDLLKMLNAHREFKAKFTSYITVPVFTNDELVTFAKTYSKEKGYKLDELATLALYTMIGDNQKDSEPVTVGKTKDMVDKAIERHGRKFRFGRSADSADGRIILKEKDFNF